jgi:hypothetical protein
MVNDTAVNTKYRRAHTRELSMIINQPSLTDDCIFFVGRRSRRSEAVPTTMGPLTDDICITLTVLVAVTAGGAKCDEVVNDDAAANGEVADGGGDELLDEEDEPDDVPGELSLPLLVGDDDIGRRGTPASACVTGARIGTAGAGAASPESSETIKPPRDFNDDTHAFSSSSLLAANTYIRRPASGRTPNV